MISERRLKRMRKKALHLQVVLTKHGSIPVSLETLEDLLSMIVILTQELLDQHLLKK